MLTQARLKETYNYFPESGLFTHVSKPWQPAGTLKKGYIYISIDGRHYFAHRLAWFWVYGEWPTNQIDHINCKKWDNRIENLRDVSASVNMQNQPMIARTNNKSGLMGVRFCTRNGRKKPYRARISIKGKQVVIGFFATAEEAHQAFLDAKKIHHQGSNFNKNRE